MRGRRGRLGPPPAGRLTPTEARRRLGLTWEEFEPLLNTGQIPYHRTILDGGKSRTLIDEAVIDAIVARMPEAAATEVVEQRRNELRAQQALMTASSIRSSDKQVRQRVGIDDHLETGVPKKPRRSADPRQKAPDAIPEGPAPGVDSELRPAPCANESCRQLFWKPRWATDPSSKGRGRFCSKACVREQVEREYRRAKQVEARRHANGL